MLKPKTASFGKLQSKVKGLYPGKRSRGFFIALKGNFKTTCTIWLKFELVRNFMPVLDTCKFEGAIRDVPLTPYFHLTDGNLTEDTYNVLRRL